MEELNLSVKLKRRRLEKGLSLSQLSRRANTSVSTLSRYENGWQRFEIYTLRKLATALGCRLTVDLVPLDAAAQETARPSGFRNLQRLFWDRKLRRRDLDDYPLWLIERVLEYGSIEDVRYLTDTIGRREFLEYAAQVRFQSAKTRNFWELILQREGVSCTKRSFRKAAGTSWPG